MCSNTAVVYIALSLIHPTPINIQCAQY